MFLKTIISGLSFQKQHKKPLLLLVFLSLISKRNTSGSVHAFSKKSACISTCMFQKHQYVKYEIGIIFNNLKIINIFFLMLKKSWFLLNCCFFKGFFLRGGGVSSRDLTIVMFNRNSLKRFLYINFLFLYFLCFYCCSLTNNMT